MAGQQQSAAVIDLWGLDALIKHLASLGFKVLGPVVRDGVIAHGSICGVGDLPMGWHDEQAPGSYRLHHENGDGELFGWAVGPTSWKADFFPPKEELWRARRDGEEIVVQPSGGDADQTPLALIAPRPCELKGLGVLDRVFADTRHPDERYRARREGTFVVAVECGSPASTCFCTSMATGPAASQGFDLCLTELYDSEPDTEQKKGTHRFIVRVGSEQGASVLEAIERHEASGTDHDAREAVLDGARSAIRRHLDTRALPELLARNIEHPRWLETADRCLSCGNCTMVCPTCFCSDVHDKSDLAGEVSRQRTWSSCFDLEHSLLHGGAVRNSIAARYRQWATHKLSTWHDQFGTSGCVGCGRCIAWCPVGIDLTEEAAAIRASDGRTS